MLELIMVALLVALGYCIGRAHAAYRSLKIFNEIFNLENNSLTKVELRAVKTVYSEQVGNFHYLYDAVSNKFIAQGATAEQMWNNAFLMYPNQEFQIQATIKETE